MQLSVSDVKVMVDMADALHWLFFGILAKHPHDETYKYLFPFFKRVQDGLTALAKGNDPLDADVDDLFKRIKSVLDEAKSSEQFMLPAPPKAKPKAKSPAKKSSGKRRVCR